MNTANQWRHHNGKTQTLVLLPGKLVKAFDEECAKHGYVREKVVAAAISDFLNSDPTSRAAMFDQLDKFLSGKKK